jgi:predicted nucleic acid-binding protein
LAERAGGPSTDPEFQHGAVTWDGSAGVELLTAWDGCGMTASNQHKAFSDGDAVSFAVMERLDIPEAIAFDEHFRQYGQLTIL